MADIDTEYFLITASDGDVRIRRLTENGVIQLLDVDEETGELVGQPYRDTDSFSPDPNGWESGRCLIIRGTIVTPQPVSVRYELR